MLKPILFNTEMVKALQEGRKTVTRRLVKQNKRGKLIKPYEEGAVLWVRETWAFWPCVTCGEPCVNSGNICNPMFGKAPAIMETADGLTEGCFLYRADGEDPVFSGGHIWRPSIHMPRQAARIFLRVTEVFPEKLQDSFHNRPSPVLELAAEGLPVSDTCLKCWREHLFTPCEKQKELRCIEQQLMELRFQKLWDGTIPKEKLAEAGWKADPEVWVIRFEQISKEEAKRPDSSPRSE